MKSTSSTNLRKSTLALAVVAACTAFANQAIAAEHVTNPYSPAYKHEYRHGVMPTRAVHAAMAKWNKAHGIGMVATGANTLFYGGGTGGVGVMSGINKAYIVFWGSQWGTASTDSNGNIQLSGDPDGAAGAAQQMFKGIGTNGELWSADLTQWCDGSGVSSGASACPTSGVNWVPYQQNIFAGAWYDNSSAAPAAATGNQIGSEAVKAAAHFGNTTAASNRYAFYMILSPTGTNPDNYQGAYCAWHDYTGDSSLTGGAVNSPYGPLAFSNQPYNMDSGSGCGVGFVNSPGTLDGWTMTLGHEWHEMESDQFPSGGWSASSGSENSDECAWIAPGSAGGAANITFATGTFAEQASWSNDTNACSISHPILNHGGGGGGTPHANWSDTISGLTVNFTDSSTDTGGTLSTHSWTFGDGGTSTTTSPSHTYAKAGTYSVTETVKDSVNGTTSSKTASVTVSSTGGTPTANWTDTTSGLTATFTDKSTDAGGTIGTHSWTFGDSGTSTATSPSHTYAKAGTYSVTETVKDSVDGKTSSKTANVTVSGGGGSTQLLVNTGFESGGTGTPWALTSGVLCNSSCGTSEGPHAGSWYAWLDGYGSAHVDTVSQQVAIPAGKTSATLQYYLHIDSTEGAADDTFTVQVTNTSGTVLGTLATFTSANTNTGYTVHTASLAPYIGQTVKILFTGNETSGNGGNTDFTLDDVTLTVQ